MPDEHPLEGIDRLFRVGRTLQQAMPEMVVMGTGYSWLRQFFPMAAAANLKNGWVKVAGLGRESFAYPDFARDLLEKGTMDPRKMCTSCWQVHPANARRRNGRLCDPRRHDVRAALQEVLRDRLTIAPDCGDERG